VKGFIFSVALGGILAPTQDEAAELARAAARSMEWKSLKYSITESVEGGRRGADPEAGVFEAGKGLVRNPGADNEAVYLQGKRANKRRDGSWRGRANPDPIEAPNLIVEDIEKNFRSLTVSSEGGTRVFTGPLTRAGTAFLMDGHERRVAGGKDAKIVASVTVDGDGNIVKIDVTGTCTVDSAGGSVAVTATRTIAFSEIDTARVEVSAEAQAALDQVQ
jgi:hypothetical protein